MVRQDKSRTGRVTPKGGEPTATGSARREPVKIDSRFSALIPILMAVFMLAGTLVILGNYIFLSSPSNWYLLGGLGLILAGIVAATQWR
ncbi:MAG: cell division protein CrgA [Actinomycetota bacterium]